MRSFGVILACITTGILLTVAWRLHRQETALPPAVPVPEALPLDQPVPATAQMGNAPRMPVVPPKTLQDHLETLVLKVPFRGWGPSPNRTDPEPDPTGPEADPQPMEASLRIRYRSHAPSSDVLRFATRYEKATRDELVKVLERQRVGTLNAPGGTPSRELFLEEVRRALQLWMFRHGTATVEQIDLTVRAPVLEQLVVDLESGLATVPNERVVEWCPSDLELKFRFNPRTDRGKAFAQISFKIAFLVQPGKLEAAQENVKQRLTRTESRCRELLTDWAVRDLLSSDGKKQLKRQLKDELTDTLFPGAQAKEIARVHRIFWTSFLVQS